MAIAAQVWDIGEKIWIVLNVVSLWKSLEESGLLVLDAITPDGCDMDIFLVVLLVDDDFSLIIWTKGNKGEGLLALCLMMRVECNN